MSKNIKWLFPKGKVEESFVLKYGQMINAELPASYIGIVTEYDGSQPEPDCFDSQKKKEAVFNSLLVYKPEKGLNIFEKYSSKKIDLTDERILPFADDPFGNLLCFDYRNSRDNPSIVFWDHEADADEGEDVLHFVSNSFDDFLDSLYEPED